MQVTENHDGRDDPRRDFVQGLRDALPLLVAASPFGAVFGAAAAAAGYSFLEVVLASATIFAGASQFVFIEVNGLGVPAWSVVLAVFAVNFRHILYSAATGRRIARFGPLQKIGAFFLLTDLQFAACEVRAGAKGERGISPGYYFGYGSILYVFWVVATALGAWFGKLIERPADFGLDFILPVYFLSILMGFRKRAGFLPVALSSGAVSYGVYLTAGPPWHIASGALAGIVVAAAMAKDGEERA